MAKKTSQRRCPRNPKAKAGGHYCLSLKRKKQHSICKVCGFYQQYLKKKSRRHLLLSHCEAEIQRRARKKDKQFKLKGSWKQFLRRQDGFKIYAVDGEWVRNNLHINFGHGGHGFVHEFIPLNEIWVVTHHFEGCDCKKRKEKQKVSKRFFDSTVIHEITELKQMKKGLIFYRAHQKAIKAELKSKIMADPFNDLQPAQEAG